MKTIENSILKFRKNQVEFFLCSKINWKLEDIELSKNEFERYAYLKSQTRKIEFLGVRSLKNYFNPEIEIVYSKNGKPLAKNGAVHISISHSKNFVAFAAASHLIGIDIEECHERILKVRNRFLNENEQKLFDKNSIRDLTIAWSAKEALFKLNENTGLDFKSDLIITNWDKASTIWASMKQNSKWVEIKLHVQRIDNLVLCFNFE